MRISRLMKHSEYADIYLDGERLTNCLEADDEAGEAVCLVKDDAGRHRVPFRPLLPHEFSIDGMICEVRRGVVEIRFNERDDDAPSYKSRFREYFEELVGTIERYQAAKARRR